MKPEYSTRLWNEDLAPAEHRKWGFGSLFAMWMCDIHSIGGYTFAAGLFTLSLGAYQVFAALCIGIIIVFLLMNLSGYAGQQLGVPYPVLARISFGTFGANLPALVRAIVAIAWYGVQTWLASKSVLVMLIKIWPNLEDYTKNNFLGESTLGWISFLFMWCIQLLLLRKGMDTIRKFTDFAGPLVWLVMFVLTIYILAKAGWHVSLSLPGEEHKYGPVWGFVAAVALTVTYFAALLLNFCDFSRFAPDRKAVFKANMWGLPVNFIAFSVVSVLVTAGTIKIWGEHLYDPVEIVAHIDNTAAMLLGAVTFAVATLGINVVANFVSPAYDIANVWPEKIDFKKGGLISAVIALVILPWNLFKTPAIVNYFLGALGALMGPLFGIIVVDYFILRKQCIVVEDLFKEEGVYTYNKGWNTKAVISFLLSSIPSIIFALVPMFDMLAPFSWFIGAGLAGLFHWLIMRNDTTLIKSIEMATSRPPAK